MLRVTSQNHSPEDIYKLYSKVGPMKIVISRGTLVISYVHIQHTYQAYMRYHRYILDGRAVEIQKAYEWYTPKEEIEKEFHQKKMLDMKEEEKRLQGQCSQRAIIFRAKRETIQFIESYFQKLDQETQNKIIEVKQSFHDEPELLKRELNAMEDKIKVSLEKITTSFKNGIKTINNGIRGFKPTKPTVIDVEPVFERKDFKKKEMGHNDFRIEEGIEFVNEERYIIKRILMINKKQFVITQKAQNGKQGQITFYNIDEEVRMKREIMEHGPYGIACFNSVLFVGDSNGGVSAHSLDPDQQLDSMAKTLHSPGGVIFDIKVATESRRIFTAGIDSRVKCFQINEELIMEGLFDISYSLKRDFVTDGPISAFELITPSLLSYSCSNKLIIRGLDDDSKRTIILEGKITRIKVFDENCIAIADLRGFVNLLDCRSQKIVAKFPHLGENICCLEVAPPHSIFFGGAKIVGMLDQRKPNFVKWRNDKVHDSLVCDLALASTHLISGDRSGKLTSWKL